MIMGLLDSIKTDENLKLYLESLTIHVLESEKRINVLEARVNWLEQTASLLEEELYDR